MKVTAKRSVTLSGVAIGGLLLFAPPAHSQTPVALVENVGGNPAGVELMDYVSAGKVIKLKSRDSIVLGYLMSCWRETIKGGTVTVGNEQSDVRGGTVQRAKVACNGSDQGEGTSFRGLDDKPPVRLYGLSPVIKVPTSGTLVIMRIDVPGERYGVTLPATKRATGPFVDFHASDKALKAGGTYLAMFGEQRIVFKIDPTARHGNVPIISRLLHFPPQRRGSQ